jgi:hypothetical protein
MLPLRLIPATTSSSYTSHQKFIEEQKQRRRKRQQPRQPQKRPPRKKRLSKLARRRCYQSFINTLPEEWIRDPNTDMGPWWSQLLPNANASLQQQQQYLNLVIHRNGDEHACGETLATTTTVNLTHAFYQAISNLRECSFATAVHRKYWFESLLTRVVYDLLLQQNKCASLESWNDDDDDNGFLGYCDMGRAHTPVWPDHDRLVPTVMNESAFWPCHFHTREGKRIDSLQLLTQLLYTAPLNYKTLQVVPNSTTCNGDDVCLSNDTTTRTELVKELHLYAVPAGRLFMFAPSFVGDEFYFSHVRSASVEEPVYLKTISLRPRIFLLYNFFSQAEADALMESAVKETRDKHRLQLDSAAATLYNLNFKRSSERGFDAGSTTAGAIKA